MAEWAHIRGRPRLLEGLSHPLVWLGATLLLLALAVGLARDSLPDLAQPFLHANPWLVVLTLALLVLVELSKALRWQALYGNQRPAYARVLQASVVGQAANAVVPIRLGELLRVTWADPSGGGLARGAASLLLSKALDAVILAFVAVWAFGGGWLHQPLALLAAATLLAAVGLAVAARRITPRAFAVPGLAGRLLAWLLAYARELQPGTVLVVLLTSAMAWGVGAAANATTMAALGTAPTMDLALRVLASGYLAGLVPAPPGRVGVFEAAVAAALVSGGLEVSTAVAVAIGLHALQIVQILLLAPLATRTRWR